ncbi:MAG: hypothetical protein GY800_01185 [Planctomycetes bacterium]|nr:hypothetical protein [Planctomycetota bacterium]
MNKISTCLAAALFLVVLTWNMTPAEAGVLLRDCRVKTVEAYQDTIQVQLHFRSGKGVEKNVHFQLGNPKNPYVKAQLELLRVALLFRKEVDVLVEDVEKKSLVLGVSLFQTTYD